MVVVRRCSGKQSVNSVQPVNIVRRDQISRGSIAQAEGAAKPDASDEQRSDGENIEENVGKAEKEELSD
jgi:hypothetical protein